MSGFQMYSAETDSRGSFGA